MDYLGTMIRLCYIKYRNLHVKRNNSRKIVMDKELSIDQEATLVESTLREWEGEAQVLGYGTIIICRDGTASLRVNFDDWSLSEGAVITLFPNDVVHLLAHSPSFRVEMLRYDSSLLREASLQLEHTVYSSLREDRCRQDSPVVTDIINCMFALLHVYFDQADCTCVTQLVLLQLKAFFVGFHEYLMRHPQMRPGQQGTRRVRELFNQFMMLMEEHYKQSRDVSYYASLMHITPKYLTTVVRSMSGLTPKCIIDQYVILQLKMQLRISRKNIKEIAWEHHFADTSFFTRYFKKHTGLTPNNLREQ